MSIHYNGDEYQNIFENAIEGIFQSSMEGRYLKVNPAMARIYGYDSPDDMVTSVKNIEKQIYVNPKERASLLKQLQENGHIKRFESQNYRKDGSIFWTQTNARIVRDTEGDSYFVEGFVTDITARKETELALMASEERYRALVERLPGAVFLDAPDNSEKTIFISSRIEDLLGYSQEEWMTELRWSDTIHPNDRERVLAESKRTDETKEPFRQEYRFRKKDGKYIWIREETSLVNDQHGEPLFWQGFLRDISEQKQAEVAIRHSEEQFKKIFQANPIASCIATLKDGRFIAANDSYWKLSGFKPDEFIGRTSIELGFITKERRNKLVARLRKEKSIQNENGALLTKSGHVRNTLEFFEFIRFDNQDCILSMFYDVTDQVKAQDALLENEEKYRQLFEAESDAIFLVDNESGNILEANAAAAALYGFSRDELLSKKNSDLSAEQEETRKVTQNIPIDSDQVISIPLRYHRKKDGTVFPVEITGRFFHWRGRVVHIAAIRDITEREKNGEALQRQLKELSILHDVALAASSSKSIDEIIERVTDTISDTLNPDNCGVGLLSENGDMLVPHISYRGTTGDKSRQRMLKSKGVTKKVAATGASIRLGDVSLEPTYVETMAGVQSELCVPIKIQSRVLGVINIESKKLDAFSEADERLLNTIAGAIATAIEQLRLFETSKRRLQELTILNAVSQASTNATSVDELVEKVTQIIGESLYPDNFGLLLINEGENTLYPHPSYRGISDGKHPRRVALGHGVSGQVAVTGEPLRVANTRNFKNYIEVTPQVRSELCVPITQGKRILGVINAESLKIDAFTSDDERLLTTIASTLSTAIEKLRLFQAEKKQRQEAEILREATTTLTTSIELDTLLNVVLDSLAKIISYDSASITLERDGEMEIVVGRGFPENFNVLGKRLPTDGRWRQLTVSRQPLIIADVHEDKTFVKWEGSEYIRGWMGIPLFAHDKIFGVINLDSKKVNAFSKKDASIVQTFANSAAVSIENAQLFEAERQSRQRAEALREATAALTTPLELDALYGTILDSLAKLLPFDSASIEILNQEYLELVAGRGLRENQVFIGKKYSYNAINWKDFELNRKPIIISDVQEDDRFVKLEGTEYIHGWMGIPMFAQDRLVGFINLDSSIKNFFTENHASLAQTFGNQAAIAIENARLFQEESRRSQIIEAMANIANEFATAQETIPALDKITQRALGLLHASTVAIYLLQDDNKTINIVTAQGRYREQLKSHSLQIGSGITGNVIATGKPEIINDMLSDARRIKVPGTPEDDAQNDTIMSAPLVLRGKTVGAINAWRQRSSGLFNESELNFLVSIANQTSMLIDSMRLFQETARRAKEAHAIAEVGRDISSTLELDIVLERIAQYAKDLIRAETSAVYLSSTDEPMLKAIAAIGKESKEIKDEPLPIGSGILGNIALQKSGEIVNDTLRDQRAIIITGTENNPDEHLMGVPILLKDKLTGLLAVWRTGKGEEFKTHELDFLSSLAQQAAVAIENARLFQVEQRQHREAETLRQAALAISTSLELGSVLEKILVSMKQVIPFSSASVLLQEGNELRLAATQGFSTPESLVDLKFPAYDKLYQEIKKSKQPIILADAQKDKRFKKWGKAQNVRGWMGIPLIERGDVIGCITLDSERPDSYETNAATLALSFAFQAAIAIHNARQFETEQRHFKEAETLRQTAEAITSSLDIRNVLNAVLNNLSRVVPYDSAALLLLEGDMVRITAGIGLPDNENAIDLLFPASNALLQEVWDTGKPLILKDAQADPRFEKWAAADLVRGWMGIPLSIRGRMLGCITIDSYKSEAYDEHDANLAMTLAYQASIAIENARLYERSEQQIRQLTVLRDIDTAISSSFDLQVTLDFLISHAIKELHVDAAAILVYNPDLQVLSLQSSHGFIDKQKAGSEYIRIGDGLAGQVALKRKLLHIPDLGLSQENQSSNAFEDRFKSYLGVPLIGKGEIKGVLEVYTRSEINPGPDWLNFLHTLAGQAAIAIDNVQLFKNLQHSNQELTLAYDNTLAGWGKALELRDKETQGHTNRVVKLTIELARRMGIEGERLTHIMRGALLHDIGKMGIPDHILNKPGPLTNEEWDIMRRHPQFAFDLMNPISYLRPALEIPYGHHERWDGSGYPLGLKEDEIPLAARIFAVVDIWDALHNERVYREAWPEEEVLEYLKKTAGIELDPDIVEKFLELIEDKHYRNQAE